MAELEIHHAHHHGDDPIGARVGLIAGVIGVVLAVVTIASHREHTAAVIFKTEANDQWSYYQAKKIRETSLVVGTEVIGVIGGDSPKAAAAIAKMTQDREHYAHESEDIKKEAEAKNHEAERAEARAFRFDVGEGLLELGLVLCSLYFMSKKRLFPGIGISAAICGLVVGISGWLL